MKQHYLTLLLLIITVKHFSQTKGDFRLGLIGGVTYTTPYGDDISKTKEYIKAKADKGGVSGNVNYRLGALTEYSLTDKVSLNIGLSYTRRSWTETFESEMGMKAYQTTYGLSLLDLKDYNVQFSFTYIDIPISVRFKLNKRLFIHGGFVYSMKMDDNVKYSYTLANGQIDTQSEYIVDFFYEVVPNNRVFGFSAGMNFHLGKEYFVDLSVHRTGKILPERYDVGFNTLSLSLVKYFNLKKSE